MPPRYSCLHTLNSIQHSITCLQFSRSGRELAVGSVDGNLKIFAVDTGKELQCFSRATAVTAILWHPSKLRTLFVGYEDGKLNIIGVLGKPCPVSGSNNFVGPVTSLDYSLRRPYLAVASGQNIHLLREDLHDVWSFYVTLPLPPRGNVHNPIQPCSIRWVKDADVLLICYLDHGIRCFDINKMSDSWRLRTKTRIAYSAFSDEKNSLVFCNLYDGFTIYTLSPYVFDIEVIPTENRNNLPLPVQFIHGDNDVLLGSPVGEVRIVSLSQSHSSSTNLCLPHGDDMIQALAYVSRNNARYIATGTYGKEDTNYVKIWISLKVKDAVPSKQDSLMLDEQMTLPMYKLLAGGIVLCSFAAISPGLLQALWPMICYLLRWTLSSLGTVLLYAVSYFVSFSITASESCAHAVAGCVHFIRLAAFIIIGLVELGFSWFWKQALGLGMTIRTSVEDLAREASMK